MPPGGNGKKRHDYMSDDSDSTESSDDSSTSDELPYTGEELKKKGKKRALKHLKKENSKLVKKLKKRDKENERFRLRNLDLQDEIQLMKANGMCGCAHRVVSANLFYLGMLIVSFSHNRAIMKLFLF